MSCNGTSAHGHTVDAKTIYCAALLFGPTYSFCGCVCSTTCLPWIRVMWCCCCICLIMHSLCVSAGASPARQMYTHTLLNLTVLQRVNKQHKFLNFTEPLPTMSVLKCEQSRAEWFPLGGVLVCYPPSSSASSSYLRTALIHGKLRKAPTVCPRFHKDSIHTANSPKGVW